MRYSNAHKQRTHTQILDAATRAFRAQGIAGVTIPRLMEQVGLTHGGFYAHFASKEELVTAACEQGVGEMAEALLAVAQQAQPGEGLGTIIRSYLSRSHRDTPESGCMIPALAAEIAREPEQTRHTFTQALQAYFARIAPFLPTRPQRSREDDVYVLMSGMIGALLLARAVDDSALSDRILKLSRDFYTQAFTTSAVGTEEPASPRVFDEPEATMTPAAG